MPTPYTGDLPYIFVIHANGDVAAAPVLDALARRYRVCYATPDAPDEADEAQIEGSVGVLFVSTAAGIGSATCLDRLAYALQLAKRVAVLALGDHTGRLPLLLRKNTLPTYHLADHATLPDAIDALAASLDSAAMLAPTAPDEEDEDEILGGLPGEGSETMSSRAMTENTKEVRLEDYSFRATSKGWAIEKYNGKQAVPVLPTTYQGKPVISIADLAFYNCKHVTKITIQKGINFIGHSAFADCRNLISVDILDSDAFIVVFAFSRCTKLTTITLPQRMPTIPDDTFFGCYSLTDIAIPASVTTIGMHAFQNCSGLTKLFIPHRVSLIKEGAFSGCSALTQITASPDNPTYHSEANCLTESKTKQLIVGCRNSSIPSYVTSIGDDAFAGCSELTSITIPASVTSIGICAFAGCKRLTTVTIENGVTAIKRAAFMGCHKLASVTYKGTMAQWEAIKPDRIFHKNTTVHCTDGDIVLKW